MNNETSHAAQQADRRWRGMLLRAALLALAYGAAHLAGWRESTGFLSGTMAEGLTIHQTAFRGGLYLLAHLGFWVLAPVLALGAVLTALWGSTLWRVRREPRPGRQ